ncbi:MAG: hypothetical protein Q4G49_15305 [Paracoccus sp. (in: a-proteobacteria)]|nr:hypothetical protein [Paracoccus sp. (in: a-proteobacteria)]
MDIAVLTADSDVRTNWMMPVYRYDTGGKLIQSPVAMDDVDPGLAPSRAPVWTPQAELTASVQGYVVTWTEHYGDEMPRFTFGAGNYSQYFTNAGVAVNRPVHLGIAPPGTFEYVYNNGPHL